MWKEGGGGEYIIVQKTVYKILVLKEVCYADQDCIYLIQNAVQM